MLTYKQPKANNEYEISTVVEMNVLSLRSNTNNWETCLECEINNDLNRKSKVVS